MDTTERHLAYDVTLAIDSKTYERTYPGGGPGYAFQMDEDTREQLRGLVERQIREETNATLDDVEIHPGYIRAVVVPDGHAGTRPKSVRSALRQVASQWNGRYGTAGANGEAVDGLHFSGDWFMSLTRPEGAPAPDVWIDEHVTDDVPDDLSDGEDPILVVEGESRRDSPPLADRDRDLSAVGVIPFDPDTYDVQTRGKYDPTEIALDWREEDREQFRETVKRRAWRGKDYRVEVHPTHIVAIVRTGSLYDTPAKQILGGLRGVIRTFNSRRPTRGDKPNLNTQRPKLETADVVYTGAVHGDRDVVDEWLEAVGAVDVSGESFDAPPEPDPADDDEAESDEQETQTSKLPIRDTLDGLLGR